MLRDNLRFGRSTRMVFQLQLLTMNYSVKGSYQYPISSFVAHSKRTLDTIFLNSGTVLATSGKGTNSFCMWDILQPPRSRRVAAIDSPFNHHYSYYSLAYLDHIQGVVIGDGHGDLSLFDIRQRSIVYTQKHVHQKAIRTISLDPSKRYFATGSTDGTENKKKYDNSKNSKAQ